MRKVIALLVLAPIFAGAEGRTLGLALEMHDTAPEDAKNLVSFYIGGFTDGYALMLIAQGSLSGASLDESRPILMDLIECVQDEDSSIVYARILVAARDNPDTPISTWLATHFGQKCEDEFKESAVLLQGGTP